jgi:hypothetical protein
MSMQGPISVRLPFRVEPLPFESPRGYLCRVSSAHGYDCTRWLVQLATSRVSELEQEDDATKISHVLRLDPDEWLVISYRHVKGPERFQQRSFCGHTVRADQFNYQRPRVCPECLREQSVWWAVWDLALVSACPKHRCLLISQCPICRRSLVWHRPAVHQCRCGADLRTVKAEPASADLVAINNVIYGAAGFPHGAVAALELTNYCLPAELTQLPLGSLLRLIRFIGLIGGDNRLRRKQRTFPRTDPIAAIQAGRATIAVLSDWPWSFREVLKRMLPEEVENRTALNFADVFGNFYRHLFHVLPRREFRFVQDAFERFVAEDWNGPIRGQHRYFSSAARENSQWISADQAEKRAHVRSTQIVDRIRQGQIEGMFLKVSSGHGRTECWIKRESLNRWIVTRDMELAQYMLRPEAQSTMGLKNTTVLRVAQAGLIRYIRGSERCFPSGFYFLREDVMKIKCAFEKHAVPAREYSKPGVLIALRHAMKNYLGRDSGLAAVIRAVVEGGLVPVGYTNRFRGITGYLFLSEDLRKYRHVPGVTVPPEGFLNYGEAASVLGVTAPVIRGLVAEGIVHAAAEYRFGLSKLLTTADVQCFAERYVATSVLAKSSHLNNGSLVRYLKELGTPLLAVPIPDAGKEHAFFLRKEVAAQIQLPSRTLLREEAERRIKDAREKKKLAEYRLARETSSGKPMRRQRRRIVGQSSIARVRPA